MFNFVAQKKRILKEFGCKFVLFLLWFGLISTVIVIVKFFAFPQVGFEAKFSFSEILVHPIKYRSFHLIAPWLAQASIYSAIIAFLMHPNSKAVIRKHEQMHRDPALVANSEG